MSDAPKVRGSQEIQQEYQQACFRVGDISYKIDVFNRDLELLRSAMRDLDAEFKKVRQEELDAEAKAKQEAPKAEEAASG